VINREKRSQGARGVERATRPRLISITRPTVGASLPSEALLFYLMLLVSTPFIKFFFSITIIDYSIQKMMID
jgi:hypothetical protein